MHQEHFYHHQTSLLPPPPTITLRGLIRSRLRQPAPALDSPALSAVNTSRGNAASSNGEAGSGEPALSDDDDSSNNLEQGGRNTGTEENQDDSAGEDSVVVSHGQSQKQSESNNGSNAEDTSTFQVESIAPWRPDVVFSLLETEAQVQNALAVLMPVLRQLKCHTSFDAEWHQPEGVNFSSPLTVHSLVQIGIAEAPLTRDSAVLVLVFDVIKLSKNKDHKNSVSVLAHALQLIMHSTASSETLQLAFDCRRDAKILMALGVPLHNVLDLQLLERATRIETVPANLANHYVYKLSGLLRLLNDFESLSLFAGFKNGVNADDSASVFLQRPLQRETVLYSCVDVASLFFLYVEYEQLLGPHVFPCYIEEVLAASTRYALFEMLAEDVRFNEHGILPMRILPRLDGNRVGDFPCSVCKRAVARAPGPCLVCRKQAQHLQQREQRKLQQQQQHQQQEQNPAMSPASPASPASSLGCDSTGNQQRTTPPQQKPGVVIYPTPTSPSPVVSSPSQQPQQQQQYVRLYNNNSGYLFPHQHHYHHQYPHQQQQQQQQYPSFAHALANNNGYHLHHQQPPPPFQFMSPQQQQFFAQNMPQHQQWQYYSQHQ